MSKTLHQIRHAFHDQIVIREGSNFVLTRKGEELMQQLPALLQELDKLYLPNTMDLTNCCRKFSFASSDYVAQAVLPAICHNLERHAPHAGIQYQLWQKDQLAALSEYQLDLVSTIAQSIPANVHGKMMAEDQLVAVFRSSHPQCADQLSIDDYCHARHILISGGGDKDSPVDKALAAVGRSRKIFASVPFFQSAVELLLKTDTMLTTPLHIAADFAQRYDLQIRALPVDIKAQQYYLLWHAKHHHNAEHKWFRELCYPHLKGHLERTINQGMKLLHTNK